MVTIIIGGDICPMGSIQSAFIEGRADAIFHDLLQEIRNADLPIANLECPLVFHENPIEKAGGFILGANVKCINGIVASHWQVLNLANNHSYDHGSTGLLETIQSIEKAGLDHVGAGDNITAAQKPLIKEIGGMRIVIYAMAEREFSVADECTPGSNPLDLINFVNAVIEYKQKGLFISLIHGGKEYYPYPTPQMIRRCRFMVDMGADAVICTHTHCPLPWEIYRGRPIVYGLGNLIFEADKQESNDWFEGYLAKLSIDDRQIHFEAIPYFQSRDKPGALKMDHRSRHLFLSEMEKKNSRLGDSFFLRDNWLTYCQQRKDNYLSELFGYNWLMRKLRRFLLPLLHSKDEIIRALLLAQCETHREVLDAIFKDARRSKRRLS
jgi:poly-gamma-glutamate capsule biosynthesis protein CapA/YwtB (metallophosphatase superfamily)